MLTDVDCRVKFALINNKLGFEYGNIGNTGYIYGKSFAA